MMVEFISATVFVGDIRATVSARYTHGISVVNRKAVYGYFLMCLLVLIGAVALIGILMAVKLMRYVEENKDKFADDFDVELKNRLTHFFLIGTYFAVLCIVYVIASVFMR